jgi:NodT family efflux transporter outer membrane factor (OMF) lipoprotein
VIESKRTVAWIGVGALAGLLGGCEVGPTYRTPEAKSPERFASGAELAAGPLRSTPRAGGVAPGGLAEWWKSLGDPTLDTLVMRAVAGNLDLKIATERVREARALRAVAGSALQPTVSLGAGITRSQPSGTTGTGFGSDARTLFDVGLDASWEIDVFGGLRRGVEAASADLDSAGEARRDVLVSLAAEVARNYVEYRGFRGRAALARRTIESQRETLKLTESRAAAGLSADIETEQARAQLAARESQVPPLETGARNAAFRLAVLLGLEPGALLEELSAEAPVPAAPAEVPVGLPSDLLRRRPDIRRAERAVAAASARIGVATADLYPKFTINAAAGLQSGELASLPDGDSRAWSIGPAVRWELFNGGRVRAMIDAAGARERQAFHAYEQQVLLAFEDVESALTAFVKEQDRRGHLERSVSANRRAVDLATDRWRSGIGDFLTVLVNQRTLYDAEDQLVQSEIAVTQSMIRLSKALGGGWDDAAAESAAAAAQAQGAQPQDHGRGG